MNIKKTNCHGQITLGREYRNKLFTFELVEKDVFLIKLDKFYNENNDKKEDE